MAGCFSKSLISVAPAGYEMIIADEVRNLSLRCLSTTGRKKAGRWNGQSALGPMCDAEKDWLECSLRASGAINGCQKSPLDEPEMKFSFFIFKPRATY